MTTLERNKRNVMAFYDMLFNEGAPAKAVRDFVGDVYIQHNPHEAVSICGLFTMMNRLIEGIGINFDYGAHPEAHPAQDRDPGHQAASYGAFGARLRGGA